METQALTQKEKKQSRVVYTGKTHTTGGRDGGTSRSSDGNLAIHLSAPGGAGGGTNPEQLFASGWSACFIGAINVAAKNLKLQLPSPPEVDSEIDLLLGDDGYSLGARLHVRLPGVDAGIANTLVTQAHQICPYSKATRGNIPVSFQIAS